MIGLAIICFLIAGILALFAFHPELSFFLDEGWKFRDKTEPSDLYVGVNLVGRLGAALLAVCFGVGACAAHFSEQSTAKAQAAADTAQRRCDHELLPRFNETIRWNEATLANADEMRSLAAQLGVEIRTRQRLDAIKGTPFDEVTILDPTKPGANNAAFAYFTGSPLRTIVTPERCNTYTLPSH